MATQSITLTERDLREKLVVLFRNEEWDPRKVKFSLRITYTTGKDANWVSWARKIAYTPSTKAMTSDASCSGDIRSGAILIDLDAVTSRFFQPSLLVPLNPGVLPGHMAEQREETSIRGVRLSELRPLVCEVLFHELYHCSQAWAIGGFGALQKEIRISNAAAVNSRSFVPPSYSQREAPDAPIEQSALDWGRFQVRLHGPGIEQGLWDHCLPMPLLNALASDGAR